MKTILPEELMSGARGVPWECPECGCKEIAEHNTGGDLETIHPVIGMERVVGSLTRTSDKTTAVSSIYGKTIIRGSAAETWFECMDCDYELTGEDLDTFIAGIVKNVESESTDPEDISNGEIHDAIRDILNNANGGAVFGDVEYLGDYKAMEWECPLCGCPEVELDEDYYRPRCYMCASCGYKLTQAETEAWSAEFERRENT